MMFLISNLIKKTYLYYSKKKLFEDYLTQSATLPNERSVEYSFIFECLSEICPNKVLDIGTGFTALPSLIRTCGFHVTAIDNIIDFWPNGLFNKHFNIFNDDIRKPKISDRFDLITCVSVLEHIEEADMAVNGMNSLLEKNGHLILTFPYNEKSYCNNVYELKGSNAFARKLDYNTQAFTRSNIIKWTADHRLEIVTQTYWRFFSGDFWTVGERIIPPEQVSVSDTHQITCILFRKT